jgi:CRISPR system Cascade subunit CasE
MSGLHLVQLPLDRQALTAFAIARGVSDDDLGYALHLALRARFGEAGPQPFRLIERDGAAPHLLGYARDPGALADAASLPAIDPLIDALFPDAPRCRAMPASWREGARFRFDVRVRPVVRYGGRVRAARADNASAWQPRAGEVDAFVAACERAGAGAAVDREAVYASWLAARLGPAAVVEQAELRSMRRTRTQRSRHDGSGTRRSEAPDVLFSGTLKVADPESFAARLARGVGRHVAFGFGMLLLAPPAPPPAGS